MLNYLRFVLAGDLAGAWANFGGLSAQMTHLGTLLIISATESASIAIAYDKAIRTTIETESRKRISDDQRGKLIKMLTEEHDVTEKQVLRDNAVTNQTERNAKTVIKQLKRAPFVPLSNFQRFKGKNQRGKGDRSSKGKGKQQGNFGKNAYNGKGKSTQNQWWNDRWSNSREGHSQPNDWSKGTDNKTKETEAPQQVTEIKKN